MMKVDNQGVAEETPDEPTPPTPEEMAAEQERYDAETRANHEACARMEMQKLQMFVAMASSLAEIKVADPKDQSIADGARESVLEALDVLLGPPRRPGFVERFFQALGSPEMVSMLEPILKRYFEDRGFGPPLGEPIVDCFGPCPINGPRRPWVATEGLNLDAFGRRNGPAVVGIPYAAGTYTPPPIAEIVVQLAKSRRATSREIVDAITALGDVRGSDHPESAED